MSTNALIQFMAGSKIKASEVNSNFSFLADDLNVKIEGLQKYLESEVSRIETTLSNGVRKTGDIFMSFNQTPPEDALLCNGSSYLIDDYKALYDVIGTTFGQEDVLHFNVPDFRDKVPEGFKDEDEPFGSFQKGKLPNIKGSFGLGGTEGAGAHAEQAFTITGYSGARSAGHDNGSNNPQVSMNASRSSDVYDDNAKRATVDRIKINFYIQK